MKPLGHVSQGARRIAARAREAVMCSGEAAVFLSRITGQAAAVGYTDADYSRALRRHGLHLVGVYVDDLADTDEQLEQLVEDLVEHTRWRRYKGARHA